MFYDLASTAWDADELGVRRVCESERFTMESTSASSRRGFREAFGMKHAVMVIRSSADLVAVAALFYKRDRRFNGATK
jgi:hypothetical protein